MANLNSSKMTVNLRKLMKKQREESKANVKKVDSPLAKYNNLGQLSCVVCNMPVKSEIVWRAHVQGRKHKQNVEVLKSCHSTKEHPSQVIVTEIKPRLPSSSPKLKRKLESTTENTTSPESSLTTKASVPPGKVKKKHLAAEKNNTQSVDQDKGKQGQASMKDALPEGFFDDPTMDAKVRKVEVKNTAEEEWAKFQKEMEHQQQASEIIVAADEDAAQVSRNISEIDEQIQRFANVEKLRDKQDEWKTHKTKDKSTELEDEQGSSDDEGDFAEYLDWRSKGAIK